MSHRKMECLKIAILKLHVTFEANFQVQQQNFTN